MKPKQDVLYWVGWGVGRGGVVLVIPSAGHQRNLIGIWVKGGSPNFMKIMWAEQVPNSCWEKPGFSGRGSVTSVLLSEPDWICGHKVAPKIRDHLEG